MEMFITCPLCGSPGVMKTNDPVERAGAARAVVAQGRRPRGTGCSIKSVVRSRMGGAGCGYIYPGVEPARAPTTSLNCRG
ncbi:hypothetical protein EVAR_9361_1 [Eumeta japonica]|uniref:Uncharacterized protein n=1 Tax=Eumeta variegata TaxID=151549 RepID=A0A4C1YTP8_EUMVA|nr:hypothetical protein EVAR_9361_1 [Eumeta japonica]